MKLNDIVLRLLLAVSSTFAVTACTVDVDVCRDPIHPHSAEVTCRFVFDEVPDAPDTMVVIANRVVNRRISAMKVSTVTGCGNFLVGELESAIVGQKPDEEGNLKPGDDNDGELDEGDVPETDGESSDVVGGDENSDSEEPVYESDCLVENVIRPVLYNTREVFVDPEDGDGIGTDIDVVDKANSDSDSGIFEEEVRNNGENISDGGDRNSFQLPVGTYRFLTFNMDSTELIYNDVKSFLDGNVNIDMGDLCVEYRVYSKDDPGLRGTIPDWQDYNPYAGYIQPDMRPLCVDTKDADLSYGQRLDFRFAPKGMSQNVDVYFDINKKEGSTPFVIDSVIAEISGLPYRINLVNGDLDISRTNKMMFRMEIVDGSDNAISDDYGLMKARCHANIDVPGIVPGNSTEVNTGPGIMQVMIFVHTVNPNDPSSVLNKMIQGKINLYNTLRRARLTDYTDDMKRVHRTTNHGVLDIQANLIIDGETIIENPDNDRGIDSWQACHDIIVDI